MNINLYLIRHTQSCGNLFVKESRPVNKDYKITKLGHKQSQISGEYLEKFLKKKEINIDKVFVSNKLRTNQTYEIHRPFIYPFLISKLKKTIRLEKSNMNNLKIDKNIKKVLNVSKYDINNFINFIIEWVKLDSDENLVNFLFYTHKGFIGDFYTYCKKVNKYPISNNNIYKVSLSLGNNFELLKVDIKLIKDFSVIFSKLSPIKNDENICNLSFLK